MIAQRVSFWSPLCSGYANSRGYIIKTSGKVFVCTCSWDIKLYIIKFQFIFDLVNLVAGGLATLGSPQCLMHPAWVQVYLF